MDPHGRAHDGHDGAQPARHPRLGSNLGQGPLDHLLHLHERGEPEPQRGQQLAAGALLPHLHPDYCDGHLDEGLVHRREQAEEEAPCLRAGEILAPRLWLAPLMKKEGLRGLGSPGLRRDSGGCLRRRHRGPGGLLEGGDAVRD